MYHPIHFHDDLPALYRWQHHLWINCAIPLPIQRSSSGKKRNDSEEENKVSIHNPSHDDSPTKTCVFSVRGTACIKNPPVMKLTQSVYWEILDDLSEETFTREKAGILLGPTAEDDLVTHYVPDEKGSGTRSSFTLDAKSLNKILQRYKEVKLNCKGVVHAHPPGVLRPSVPDLQYVAKLFSNPKNKEATQVMLPIVCNGRFYPYLIDATECSQMIVPHLILI